MKDEGRKREIREEIVEVLDGILDSLAIKERKDHV